ncbi:hypothetical protein VTI74DRAFT_6842 [Chaetomium olivicolor]
MAMLTTTLPKASYVLHKSLPGGLFLVRRTTDGELLLGQPLEGDLSTIAASSSATAPNFTLSGNEHAKLLKLITLGAARPAANLLNHENLVSIHDELVSIPWRGQTAPSGRGEGAEGGEGGQSGQRMFLWDYCDAGTLQDVFNDYEPSETDLLDPVAAGGFLPESFVWHVGLGLLRALQWLHEGVRDVYGVAAAGAAGAGNSRGKCKRVRGKSEPEQEWMPVLHRDVTAGNVFLQQPRGVETYGAVKLGNFERCWVSSGVSRIGETPVVAMKWEDEGSLGVLRERKGQWKRDGLGLSKVNVEWARL